MSISVFPHCDARILHAPGKCKYCDMHTDWQELRVVWGIAFTGEPTSDKQPISDPADLAVMFRQRGDYDIWDNNRPQ